MGFIQPQEGLRILDMGMLKQYYNLLKVDENQAQRENLMLKRLTPEDVYGFEQQWQQGVMNGDPDKVVPGQVDAEGNPIPLATPSVIPVNDYDNHAVHIEIHNRFRKSQSFDVLPDEIRAQFQKHISMHESALQQKMMQDALMQQQMAAGPVEQQQQMPAPSEVAVMPDQAGMTAEQLQ
jgi:hypothetical protein